MNLKIKAVNYSLEIIIGLLLLGMVECDTFFACSLCYLI